MKKIYPAGFAFYLILTDRQKIVVELVEPTELDLTLAEHRPGVDTDYKYWFRDCDAVFDSIDE